ncbi:MAG: rane protein of unknown function, partial [candidate division NC10 bacterium]|nr:rane protein of unknown function [candidate division NC10 bacterium]
MIMRLFSHPWARRIFIGVCLVVVTAQAGVVTHRRERHIGDYDISREMGRRFLAGEHLYAGGLHYPYTPSAALSFAPLALVRPGLGLAIRYGAAVAGLWLTLRLLRVMVGRGRRLDSATVLAVEVVTLVLGAQYILRDLDDGGPHLLLLTILVGGAYCVSRGRDVLGATWFGLATVLKAPAGLFLPFLLWKRQWKLAGLSVAAAILWTMLPMVWMGPASWWSHEVEWTRTALQSVLGHPTPGVQASEQRVQNQSLTLAVTRYLVTYPDGHPLRVSHPAYVSFLDLDPEAARRVATGVVGILLLVCAWLMRRRYRGRDDPAWLLECSAVLILALLLSPVTWTQHLVFVVPALYLIAAEGCGRSLGAAASAAMWAYAV